MRDLRALHDRRFDLVVIGGGITGACLAHDAALRGLSVALVDKGDFGGATSAASSKLLHGGIRYLQQLQLAKLRESALERCYFQRVAPHLTRYVPFLIPTFRGFVQGRTALDVAMRVYALLCAGQNDLIRDRVKRVPAARTLSRTETLRLAPVLGDRRNLTGSCVLYESHMHSSERMTLAFVKSAMRHGAVAANYVAVEGPLTTGRTLQGVRARDGLSGDVFEIRSRIVANASGPWIPGLNRAFQIPGLVRDVTRHGRSLTRWRSCSRRS
jgi:glycerol-3-phosphate dehydrogenase